MAIFPQVRFRISTLPPVTCPNCNRRFAPNRSDQLYCSTKCRTTTWRRANPNGKPVAYLDGEQPSFVPPAPIPPTEQPTFSTAPSTAEEDILALWKKKDDR